MKPADRDEIEELLQDPSLSCRAISRATGYSDWTIRKIARELDGDLRPMKQRRSQIEEPAIEEASEVSGWLVFGIIAAGLVLVICASARWTPPPEL